MNWPVSDEGVYRTAPATQGLLNSLAPDISQSNSSLSRKIFLGFDVFLDFSNLVAFVKPLLSKGNSHSYSYGVDWKVRVKSCIQETLNLSKCSDCITNTKLDHENFIKWWKMIKWWKTAKSGKNGEKLQQQKTAKKSVKNHNKSGNLWEWCKAVRN